MSCQYQYDCLNTQKCYRCKDQRLYKPSNKKSRMKTMRDDSSPDRKQIRDNSWEDLEQKVADKISNVPDIKEARRSRNSGALWFETGDVVDEILHPECKERMGNTLKSGDRTMSISKLWLEKAKEECSGTDKTMCLPFRFKGDSNIYCIFDMDDIAGLITTMKAYMKDNDILRKRIEVMTCGKKT